MIVPPQDDDVDDAEVRRPALVDHHVVCLAEAGTIAGKLAILKDVRVSDFLQNQSAFFVLIECHAQLNAFPAAGVARLLVNAQLVVGIAEIAT